MRFLRVIIVSPCERPGRLLSWPCIIIGELFGREVPLGFETLGKSGGTSFEDC